MSMLRSIREKKGLTLGQLAAKSSISARTLTEYEEGRQPIPLSHAKLLAKALWVQIEDLMPPAGAAAATIGARPAPAAAPAATPQYSTPAQSNSAPSPQPPRPAAPPSPAPQGGNGTQYAPRPAEQAPQRPFRDAQQVGGYGQQRPVGPQPGGKKGPEGRAPRPPRPAPQPPKPITEGQTEELVRLGARLGMEQEQLEEHIGKQVAAMTRTDAKDWIKKLREQAAESSPGGKVHYGHWPGSREDEEATYLATQREASSILRFKLFSGEEFSGTVTEFTPYTITVRSEPGGEETVLRKLAIVYYRQTGETAAKADGALQAEQSAEPAGEPVANAQSTVEHSHPTEETGIDSDRVGEPATAERDSMDEDRGV